MDGYLFDVGPIASPGEGVRNRNDHYRESKPKHSGQRLKVYEFIRTMSVVGATREQIAESLGIPLASVCGRVSELLKCDDVIETAERRPTKSGGTGVVVVARGA